MSIKKNDDNESKQEKKKGLEQKSIKLKIRNEGKSNQKKLDKNTNKINKLLIRQSKKQKERTHILHIIKIMKQNHPTTDCKYV